MNKISRSSLYALIAVLCAVAFVLPSASPAHAAPGGAAAHVYLLRGLMDVSEGMDVLAARFNQLGIPASAHSHTDGEAIAAQARDRYASGVERTIILIGHSLGATAAVEAARELEQAGVPVALVVTIDPVSTAVMPANVGRAVNLYVGRESGQKVQAESGFHGTLSNLDFSADPTMDHMAIQRAAAVHARIVALVTAAAGSRHAAARSHHRS